MSERTNIVLVGFMGTGKTTVGQIVADRLNLRFVDLDTLIEDESGQSIAQIFSEQGEGAFRQIEARIAKQTAADSGQVIATGGGALLNDRTREAYAASSLMVCLTAEPDAIFERVGDDPTRPLFTDPEAVLRLMSDRAALYASLPYHVDTTHRTPQQAAEEVIRIWSMQHTL